MARIIRFQIPEKYRPGAQVVITITRGKVIEFPTLSERPEQLIGSGGLESPGQWGKRSDFGGGGGLSVSQAAGIL